MPRFILTLMLLCLCDLALPQAPLADKSTAAQMQQLLVPWPPTGWQLTPPGADTPYPPYIADGEFSGTIYRQGDGQKLWSAYINITDQQTEAQARKMLNKFPFCAEIEYNQYPARNCGSQGEELGRRSLAYAVNHYLVEISLIGPIPLELPEFDLHIPPDTAVTTQ